MEFMDPFLAGAEDARLARLAVSLSPDQCCWVGLPPPLIARYVDANLPIPLALEVTPLPPPGALPPPAPPRPLILAWGGAAARGPFLEVPAGLASALGLTPGVPVAVTPLPALPPAVSVTVEPAGPDDWELVECHAADLEADLLTQVGVVAVGQPFPYWVRPADGSGGGGGGRPILLTASAAAPAPAVRLVPGCEVAVAPRPRARVGTAVVMRGNVGEPGPPAGAPRPPGSGGGAGAAASSTPPPPPLWVRVLPPADAPAAVASTRLHPAPWSTSPSTTVWVCPAAATAAGLAPGSVVCVATRLHGAAQAWAALATHAALPPGHAVLPAALARAVGATPYGRIALLPASAASGGDPPCLAVLRPDRRATAGPADPSPTAARLATLPPPDLATLFASWLSAQARAHGSDPGGAVVLHDGGLVRLADDGGGGGSGLPPPPPLDAVLELHWPGGDRRPGRPILLDAGVVGGGAGGALRVEVGPPADLPPPLVEEEGGGSGGPPPAPQPPAPWVARHVQPALSALLPALDARARAALASNFAGAGGGGGGAAWPPASTRSGVLVTGPRGCGKSALADAVADAAASHPACRAAVVRLSCAGWDVADDPAGARADLEAALGRAAASAPSLLILDDVDVLGRGGGSDATPLHPGEALDPAAAGGAAVGAWLVEALSPRSCAASPFPPGLPLAVLATAGDGAGVPSGLTGPGGVLSSTVALPPLSAAARAAVLKAALAARGAPVVASATLRSAAAAADGCDAADLAALADRAVHAAAVRVGRGEGGAAITAADLAAAAAGFEPAAAWAASAPSGAHLGGSAPSGWEDVGGLGAARAALTAALAAAARAAKPSRGPPPLRPRTGVLLYGPPGCGKTHALAAAIAASKTRVVAVKGPELLNKYIGASEAAVRAVFARAAAAAPCVLLFDEFDALAPRRGADSTGVTDRVVNQLLTELDGATGLAGVVVLAATSRPDLLDPALLRPGRLDRSVYCGPPSSPAEREAILRALARKANLGPDAVEALPSIAAASGGFTGADLGAVLADAQLAAVHAALEEEEGGEGDDAAGPPVITAEHLRTALASARPSLPPAELARLQAVYARFAGVEDGSGGGAASAAAAAQAAARAAAKGKAKLVLRPDGGENGDDGASGLLAALELGGGDRAAAAGSRVTMA